MPVAAAGLIFPVSSTLPPFASRLQLKHSSRVVSRICRYQARTVRSIVSPVSIRSELVYAP